MKQKGFLELSVATVFGLVALAASAVGIILGSVAVQKKTPPPSKAEEACISFEISPVDETVFSNYQTEYNFEGKVCNPDDGNGPTQISSFIYSAYDNTYISGHSGGLGVQTLEDGECATATGDKKFTVSMQDKWTEKDDQGNFKTQGTTTSVRVYAISQNVGDWGCYAELKKTIIFGSEAPTPTPTPTCECDPWLNGECGGWTCNINKRHQYRGECEPYGCDITNQCVDDDTCEPECFDSDGGKNYFTKGYVDDFGDRKWDNCFDENTLTEFYCEEAAGYDRPVRKASQVNCPNGCDVGNGKCAGEPPIICDSTNCAGCCQDNICYPGTEDNRCGKNGVFCSSCPSNYECTSGTCLLIPSPTQTPPPGDSCKDRYGNDWVCWTAPGVCPGEVQTPPGGTCYSNGFSSNACCKLCPPSSPTGLNVTVKQAAVNFTWSQTYGVNRHILEVVDKDGGFDTSKHVTNNPQWPWIVDKHNLTTNAWAELSQTFQAGKTYQWRVWSARDDCSTDVLSITPTYGDEFTPIPAAGGGVPFFETDLDNNGITNSLDWGVLVTGWIDGNYTALDASLFLWNWATH